MGLADCIEGLRAKALCSVIQCSAVLRGSLFGVCVMVTSCVSQLDFNKGYYYYYYYYYVLGEIFNDRDRHAVSATTELLVQNRIISHDLCRSLPNELN